MDFSNKGQLSAIILSSLCLHDMYGLEIIQDIAEKSGGSVVIKQPSLYSNLKRMETLKYISSYWKDSDIGGKRHYYSITDLGRKQSEQMQAELNYIQNKVSALSEPKTIIMQQDNFLSKPKEQISTQTKIEDSIEPIDSSEFLQYDIFSKEIIPTREETKPASTSNDAVFLSPDESLLSERERNFRNLKIEKEQTHTSTEQVFTAPTALPITNEKIFDLTKELKSLKRKKSFADKQLQMEVSYKPENLSQKEKNKEIIKSTIKTFESAFVFNELEHEEDEVPSFNLKSPNEKNRDDAVFITEKANSENLPKVHKIDPVVLNVPNRKNDNHSMPAPKKDLKIEPSYKDMIESLYDQGKKNEEVIYSGQFSSYKELDRYYKDQGIELKEYNKNAKPKIFQTNKVVMLKSAFNLISVVMVSLITFLALFFTKNCNYVTSFVYLIPAIFMLIDFSCKMYKYRSSESKPPKKSCSMVISSAVILLTLCIVIGLNLLFGLESKNFLEFSNTLIYPIILLICIPINYFIDWILKKKYLKI